ncbi:glycosyltransferase family 4 protein, partial [Acinetobacter baumannii]|nr:glycosyltransferase family 4 protein [Acinetobacter baumannii]
DPSRVRVIPKAVSFADLARPGREGRGFRLGMVGIVPLLKRPDRALDLLGRLRAEDDRFTLHIRGRMPWEYPHVWRKPLEREGYLDLFARLGAGPLRDAVAFEPFGADMGT